MVNGYYNYSSRYSGRSPVTSGGGSALQPLGSRWEIIGHSYEAFGIKGATVSATTPLIQSNTRAPMPLLFALNPQYKHENWLAYDYAAGIPVSISAGTPVAGETVTCGGVSGTLATINAAKTTMTVSAPNGQWPSSGAITFGTSGATGTTTGAPNFSKNCKGDLSAISGDMIDTNAGYEGGYVRLATVMARKPVFLTIDIAFNSLNNGVAAATAVSQYMAYRTYALAHANASYLKAIFFVNCNPLNTTSGFDGLTIRQATSDFNLQLQTAVAALPDYNTRSYYIDQFSALIESPTNLAADLALYVNSPNAKGLKYLDNAKAYDTLHPSTYGSYLIGKLQSDIANTKIVVGSYFATTYRGGTNSITTPNAAGTGTAGSRSSNVSGSSNVITGLTINGYVTSSTNYYNGILLFTPLAGTFTAGETVTAPTGSATGTVVTAGALAGKLALNTTSTFTAGDVVTGGTSGATGTVTYFHPVSIVPSIVAGTGNARDAAGVLLPGNNGIPVGSNGQKITFTEGGFTNVEKIQMVFNTITTGVAVGGVTDWVRAFDKCYVLSGYAMIANIRTFITRDTTNQIAEYSVNDTAEATVTATVAPGGVLTVTAVSGTIRVGGTVVGNNIPPNTIITSQLTAISPAGGGGTGTYQLNSSFTSATAVSMLIGCGAQHLGQNGEYELLTPHVQMPGTQANNLKHNIEFYITPGATGTAEIIVPFGADVGPWLGVVNDPTIAP